MEYRLLGGSGLKVPVLSFGAAHLAAAMSFSRPGANTEVDEARRLVDICLEAGVNLFDTADGYSDGRSEEVLGKALEGRRDQVADLHQGLLSASATGPTIVGSSRYHLLARARGQPAAARHRLHRHLPPARL